MTSTPTTDESSRLTIESPRWPGRAELERLARTWFHFESERLPWNQLRLTIAYARRDVYARRPRQGNALRMLRENRLEIGRDGLLETNVTLRSHDGRIRIGAHTGISRGSTVGAVNLVEIGDHCMIGQGCYITDGDHRHDDPSIPIPDQGMVSKGPTILEDNVWLGANVIVTAGVRIGAHSVVGANSVVTRDIPPYSVAAGSPAKVVAQVKNPQGLDSPYPPSSSHRETSDPDTRGARRRRTS